MHSYVAGTYPEVSIFLELIKDIVITDEAGGGDQWLQNYHIPLAGELSHLFCQEVKQEKWLVGSYQESRYSSSFQCTACGNGYKYRRSLLRHIRLECGKEPQFQCPACPLKFKHRNHLVRHASTKHHKWNLSVNKQQGSVLEFRVRWVGPVPCMGRKKNACQALMWKSEGRRTHGRTKGRWEGNTKVYQQEIGLEGVDWIYVACCVGRWWDLVNRVVNHQVACFDRILWPDKELLTSQ